MTNFSEISKNFRLLNPGNLDFWYGPYSSVDAANSFVPSVLRSNRKIAINTDDGIAEYWWKSGNADTNLIPVLLLNRGESLNIFDKSNYLDNKAISTIGAVITQSGYKTSTIIPIESEETQITISNVKGATVGANIKRLIFLDSLGNLVGSVLTLSNTTYIIPATAVSFQFTFKRPDDETDSEKEIMVEYGSKATEYTQFGGFVIGINNLEIGNADKSVVEKTDIGKLDSNNILNKSNFLTDTSINSVGGLGVTSGYKTTVPIVISASTQYVFSGVSGGTKRYRFLNSGGVLIGAPTLLSNSSFTSPSTAAFIQVTFNTNLDSTDIPIQLELGTVATTYIPFGGYVTSILGQTIRNTDKDFIQVNEIGRKASKNIFNKNEFLSNSAINSSGGIAVTSGYKTSLPIVLTGSNYTISGVVGGTKRYRFLDGSGNLVGSVGIMSNITITKPVGAASIQMCFQTSTDPVDVFIQLQEGSVKTSYEPFGFTIISLRGEEIRNANKDIYTKEEVDALIASSGGGVSGELSYIISSNQIVANYEGGSITGEINNSRGYTGNNMFNFSGFNLNGRSAANGDDVAPIHAMNTTIGANHGQPLYIATVTAHGLTNTSIGRSWTKGGITFYLMRILTANTLLFISQNQGTALSPSFSPLTTGTLTGTPNLNVTAIGSSQLYPSINNLTQKVLKNGKDLADIGSGTASFIDVVEEYDIMSINDIINNIIARAGTAPDPVYTGSSIFRIKNVYRFLPNSTVIIFVNAIASQAVSFKDIMAAQAAIISGSSDTQYYVPNSNPVGSLDFRTPVSVTWSDSIPQTFFNVASSPDPLNPPNRVIQYSGNLGFMLGVLKTQGVGRNLPNYTENTFEIRYNTGKVYPHPVESGKVGSPIPVNSSYNMTMVRSYTDLTKTRIGNRLSCFNFTLDGSEYVFLDYSGSMNDIVNLNKPQLNGRTISVVEQKNTSLRNDIYNSGFSVNCSYVSGETAFLVLKIE